MAHTAFPLEVVLPRVLHSVTAAMYTLCTGAGAGSSLAWRRGTARRSCFSLVGQDVNKGHREDPLPLRLPFDVPDLGGEKKGVRLQAAGRCPGTSPVGQCAPRLFPDSGRECGFALGHPLVTLGERTVTNYNTSQNDDDKMAKDRRYDTLGTVTPTQQLGEVAIPGPSFYTRRDSGPGRRHDLPLVLHGPQTPESVLLTRGLDSLSCRVTSDKAC